MSPDMSSTVPDRVASGTENSPNNNRLREIAPETGKPQDPTRSLYFRRLPSSPLVIAAI